MACIDGCWRVQPTYNERDNLACWHCGEALATMTKRVEHERRHAALAFSDAEITRLMFARALYLSGALQS